MSSIVITLSALFVLAMATIFAAAWVAERFGPSLVDRASRLSWFVSKKKSLV